MPEAGKDCPRLWNDFLDWFDSEGAGLAFLEGLRWPQGFVCPSGATMAPASRASRGRLRCKGCGHQSTVSARGLQRVLGLASHQTAWTMLHRFRKALVRRDRERLHGQVEVDETDLAITDREAPVSPAKRKNNTSQVLVAVAVERLQPRGFGRIRLQRLDNDSDEGVVPFVQATIEPGARVTTDGSAAHRNLSSLGYQHKRIDLDEFVFRFNRRTSVQQPGLYQPGWCAREAP